MFNYNYAVLISTQSFEVDAEKVNTWVYTNTPVEYVIEHYGAFIDASEDKIKSDLLGGYNVLGCHFGVDCFCIRLAQLVPRS